MESKEKIRKWNKLLAQYTFIREYKKERSERFENPIGYRIPNWPKDLYE